MPSLSPGSDVAAASPSKRDLIHEFARLREHAARHPGPGRVTVLGWDLEYTDPGAPLAFLDHTLFRRLNDFIADHPRPVILDCGANIGYTVLHYKRQYPDARITAFEPDPQFAPLLRRNLSRNGARDVTVIEAAAWVEDGREPWVTEPKDGSRLQVSIPDTAPSATVATVDLARHLAGDVDLLKMDIEGAEFVVVPHLASRLDRVKNIVVECHVLAEDDYEHLAELVQLLRASGFKVGLNSFGPWRDGIRRPTPAPLHARQYFLLAGWRERSIVSDSGDTAAPYLGLAQSEAIDRLAHVDAENHHLREALANVLASPGAWDVRQLTGPFRPNGGYGWTMPLPDCVAQGDAATGGGSLIVVLEDGRVLGPAHALHEDIRRAGNGRYSHWRDLYFSSSDGSDPNRNGRRYSILIRSPAGR